MENTDRLPTLILDDEFSNLIQPLSGLDYHRMGMKIKEEGSAMIRIWNDIVLNDLHIYKICVEHHISYDVTEKFFQSRHEAISYICSEELKRDDHTNGYMKYLIGKKFLAAVRNEKTIKVTKMSIATRLGEELNIAPGTVQKYGLYADALDSVFASRPAIAQEILMGRLRISHENTVELSRLPKEELAALEQILSENHTAHLSYADIRHELRWKNYTATTSKPRPTPSNRDNPEIRKMPQYDPNAQLSSLTLTIPSWISSVNRAMNHTTFEETSIEARNKLSEQLYSLRDAINQIFKEMEGSQNG